jgi:hypothetical protein
MKNPDIKIVFFYSFAFKSMYLKTDSDDITEIFISSVKHISNTINIEKYQ